MPKRKPKKPAPKRPAKKPAKPAAKPQKPAASSYARKLAAETQRQAANAKAHNNIGPIPACVDPERRAACEADAELFYKTYFPEVFPLPFSDDHREFIATAEQVIEFGGIVPLVMARASGKTALCRRLVLRAILYGKREYVFLINADAPLANRSLDAIKGELRFNPLLYEDFPEVCHPIRKLEGKAIRATSQHLNGVPTRIVWTEGRLVFPTVEGSIASGAIIDVAGIEGQIRGRNVLRSDGKEIRPDYFVLDDPQTHASAHSDSQVETREQILMSDIIHGAGPTQTITGIIPCTVIRKGDLADRILDKKRHPEFRGRRFKAIYAMPKNGRAWERYAEVLRDALEEEDDTGKVNAYYEEHRAELEEGAIVAWPERKKEGYATALQELMELKILNPEVFASEYQGEPLERSELKSDLTPELLASKLNRLERGTVAANTQAITAFIDIQQNLLYYVVCAWSEGFAGSVIDYGTWPDTGRSMFKLAQIDRDFLAKATKRANLEEQLYAGMQALTSLLIGASWRRDGTDTNAKLGMCLIDRNWPESTNVVYEFCRQSPFSALLMPSQGTYYGAKRMALSDRQLKEGSRRGLEWEIPAIAPGRPVKHIVWDTNFWKNFVLARLTAPMGARGCLSVFGYPRGAADVGKVDPRMHRMFFDHLRSERRTAVEANGRSVDEWDKIPGEDNHWFDGLVGSAVAASVLGVGLGTVHAATAEQARPRVRFSEQQAQARGRR